MTDTSHAKRRISRREALATYYGSDINTFAPYQPGSTRIPVFTEGRHYYTALRPNENPPAEFEWIELGKSLGYIIFTTESK